MKVWIPAYSLQRDPAIYPDPDKFDPERFDEEAIQNRNPSYYLPFGDGPRNCIGNKKISLIFIFFLQRNINLIMEYFGFRGAICQLPSKSWSRENLAKLQN